MKFFLLSIGLILSSFITAQTERYTISGNIKDGADGEDLPFAEIFVKEDPTQRTETNEYGFYSLSLPKGKYTVMFSYFGYTTVERSVTLDQNQKISLELTTEVVITGIREDQNLTRNEGSLVQIDMKDVKSLPALGGEPDIMSVVTKNPGIKSAGEGNSGFYVRGGGLDQNLVLLDEAPVYNPSHLLGFFSVFNGDAIKSATAYKGGMLPEYGGRTSSVLDIRMKDGNSKKFSASGGIGLIASRLTLESPIVKDKGSIMISGRRTYADLFLKLSSDEQTSNTSLFFYDLNLKANYRISEKDRIFLSGYFGRDKFGFGGDFGLDWGNKTATLRWNHLFSDKLFSNTTFIFSDYDYQFGFGQDEDNISLQSVIRDFNLKQDFSLFPNSKNSIKFGFNAIYHRIEPGNLSAGSNTGVNASDADPAFGLEGAAYIQNKQKINTKWSINYGLRYSLFSRLGAGSSYTYDSEGNLLSESAFSTGENMQFYGGFEPRLSSTYVLNKVSSVKLGYNRNYQYIHLLSNATSSTPTDTWIMSSNNVKPQIADQVSLGYFRNFKDNMFETSAEVYYKGMQNMIDYRTGANVFLNEQLEGGLVYGTGTAYGLELLFRKKKGKLTGWISYTLSRSLRKFDEIDNGAVFPARQDRIHDLSIVALYELTPKLSLSANFVYYTGDAVTFPTGRYTIDGMVVPYYTERNGYRMPDYHRLDLGVVWKRKQTEKFESNWNFSIYNVYGRENAYSISFQPSETDPNVTEAVQLSLFKWVPSFSYNFKF